MWTIGFAERLRFPRFPSKLEKRGNACLRPHTHRPRQQGELIIDDSKNHTRPAERTNGSTSNHLTPKAPYKPDPKVCWVKCAVVAHGYGANRDGERRCGRRSTVDLSADGNGHPSDLRDAEWAARTADPPGVGGSVTAQDRYARGDERHLLFAAHWLPLALSAPRQLSGPPRASTTSFASSNVMASGRRSRPSCMWRCASGWAGRPAPRLRFSTASRSNQPKRGQ